MGGGRALCTTSSSGVVQGGHQLRVRGQAVTYRVAFLGPCGTERKGIHNLYMFMWLHTLSQQLCCSLYWWVRSKVRSALSVHCLWRCHCRTGQLELQGRAVISCMFSALLPAGAPTVTGAGAIVRCKLAGYQVSLLLCMHGMFCAVL